MSPTTLSTLNKGFQQWTKSSANETLNLRYDDIHCRVVLWRELWTQGGGREEGRERNVCQHSTVSSHWNDDVMIGKWSLTESRIKNPDLPSCLPLSANYPTLFVLRQTKPGGERIWPNIKQNNTEGPTTAVVMVGSALFSSQDFSTPVPTSRYLSTPSQSSSRNYYQY